MARIQACYFTRERGLRAGILSALLALLAWPPAADAAAQRLVENGKSAYSIVIAPDASPSERHAATELQSFLEQMSGARLPITSEPQRRMVLVGRSAALDALKPGIRFDELGPEGFALKTKGRHVIIAGGRLRGTMYGVYEFLERLGCRWFTAQVSRIPKTPSIPLPRLDEAQKPSFEAREPFFAEAADPDWAARNKVNGRSMRLDATRGGKVVEYPFGHSFDRLVPAEKYFKEHPEYFSLVDGRRRIDRYRSQLCLTNPDVLRIATESVERIIAERPEVTNISVGQNDGEGWCECDNCRRVEAEEGGAHSGPVIRFVNAVAEAVVKKHPEKLINTFAYHYTIEPPLKTRPHKNVRIRVCPIEACFAHPFEKCEYNAKALRDLQAWSKVTDQLYVWHYNINFLHYLLPFPDFDELAADIPMYARNGVVGLFMEGSPDREGGAENAELRSYVMAKLMWNVKADPMAAVREFHEAYYGPAANPMLAYFDLMHRQVRPAPQGKGHHVWISDPPSSPYLNDEFLARAAELFRKAAEAADTDAIRSRVRKAGLALDYIRINRAKKFVVHGDTYAPSDLNGVKETWAGLIEAVRGFGMSHISENSTIAQEDANFQQWVRPYRVATIENERLRVHVVPELGGRVTHIIDKRSGRNLLHEPEPNGTRSKVYPNMGGLTVSAYSDYVARAGHGFRTWSVEPGADPGAMTLRADSGNGLTLRRTLQLDGAFLCSETVLENGSGAPVQALIESRWDADASGQATAAVKFAKQSGGSAEQVLTAPGRKMYDGGEQPDGMWKLAGGAGGITKVNRFPKDSVVRCALDWGHVNENRVTMSVVSPRRTLAPGERVTLRADYGVE